MQRLIGQLPDFARPSHPIMRYVLMSEGRRVTRRSRFARLLLAAIILVGLLLLGWQLATDYGRNPLDFSTSWDNLFLVLFWPLVIAQTLMRLFALGATSGVIATETQRGTWDTLKVTTNGANLTMKTRWAAVFYRLRGFLILILIGRIVFVVLSLINLTSFQGRYLDLLLSGTTPFGLPDVSKETSVLAGIIITSMMMTGALLAPFTAIAFDASIGMLLGTVKHGRLLGILGQGVLLIMRVLITGAALHLASVALSLTSPNIWPYQEITNSPALGWVAAFFGIAEGDMGLSLLHLPYVQQLWADRDYGVLVGAAFLGYVLLQAALANALVKWAGNRAAKADAV